MERKEFLQALDVALSKWVPTRERAEMLRYYEEYFDEAGPEGEASVMESLGDPAELARKLAAEAGFDAPLSRPAAPKKRRVWPWVLGAVVLLVVLALSLGLLIANFGGGPSGEIHQSPAVTQSAERLDPDRIIGATEEDPLVVEEEGHTAVYGRVFHTVEVEVPLADVTVLTGENYGVELFWDKNSAYYLKVSVISGVLKVSASHKSLNGLTVEEVQVVVTLPADQELNELDVEMGMGDILLDGVAVREVDCETGMGDVTVKRAASRNVSAGTGMGDILWEGPLARDTELETGMGDIKVTADTVDGWGVALSTGTGDVTVNGQQAGKSFRQWGSAGELEAFTGMGNITLKYEN